MVHTVHMVWEKVFGKIFLLLFFRSSCCLQLILIFQNTNANRCVTLLYCYKFVHHNQLKQEEKKSAEEAMHRQGKHKKPKQRKKMDRPRITIYTQNGPDMFYNNYFDEWKSASIITSYSSNECLIFFMNLFFALLSYLIIDLIIRKEDETSASNHENEHFSPSPVIVSVSYTGYLLYTCS